MDDGFLAQQALVRTLLEHPEGHPWRMSQIGLMALRLDDHRHLRLHLWDPEACEGEPPIHDHPYGFTSTVVAGELVDTRWLEDPAGDEYVRQRYQMADEDQRRVD